MVKKSTSSKIKDESRLYAWIGAFIPAIGFFIVQAIDKKDKYSEFYSKQGLILAVGAVIVLVLSAIPYIGWYIFRPILWFLWTVLWLVTWINALTGKERNTFIIGEFAEKLKI